MFPDHPRWAQRHIEGGETGVQFGRDQITHRGFIDNLVDSTAIEYESNLTCQDRFDSGYEQVKNYCAALINEGRDQSTVIGVLSDTVRWRAYRVASITRPASGLLGGEHLTLEEIEQVDGSAATDTAAKNVLEFLVRHLGRLGARPLSGVSIAHDFGFESTFCVARITAIRDLTQQAFEQNPIYGNIIEDLWRRFVSFVGAPESAGMFERSGYADELYLLTLAKLVCANALEKRVLIGDPAQIKSILKGDYFRAKGLNNIVEYDYFGWLHQTPYIDHIVSVALEMQDDLCAYDFYNAPSEDLFGELFAQLAKRSQRLLLGQVCTPRWLARAIVNKVVDSLPANEMPRLVDMCCGSGSIVVEAVLKSKIRIAATIPETAREERVQELVLAITGFDIDPLAVILAKIGWVLAARDWLEPLGSFSISIPIYHADSLFAITPISTVVSDGSGSESYQLQIADAALTLPGFLISPEFQGAFDAIIDTGYGLATANHSDISSLSDAVIDDAIDHAMAAATLTATTAQTQSARAFLDIFIRTVARLNREGRNGIWAFILRNSYRPGIVAGQFNGLVSNPPWLALSRIADNPYRIVLRDRAEQFGIKPPGPSFLHIEMATIFLLHAVDRYLQTNAKIGCIVPDSVLTGYNHNPFRTATYAHVANAVDFRVDEIWRISNLVFENRGAVLIGSKESPSANPPSTYPGFLADESGMTPLTIYHNVQGVRTAWSERATPTGAAGFFEPANFRQGADIMPRTLFFHELSTAPQARRRAQWSVNPIDRESSNIAFAVKDAKKSINFHLTSCVLPDDLFFDVFISHLLTPFHLSTPIRALLPIRKGDGGEWHALHDSEITAIGPSVANAFREMCETISPTSTVEDLWALIDTRNKLSQQKIVPSGYLVVTGTSGEIVCSAFIETNVSNVDRLIIDQTLNWAQVNTLDEALYLTGLLNSEAINDVIRDFQPEGAFGRRHIHSLPFRATPPFDPTQSLHQDVVAQTRALMREYENVIASDHDAQAALNPNASSLAMRRRIIGRKIRALPTYTNYSIVCKDLYGV
ncbi:MAG: hypothetical protein V1853_04975 [bacterium]